MFEAAQAERVRAVGQHDLGVGLEANAALELPLQIQLRETGIPSPEPVDA
jgi:hypothetical protein